MNRTIIAVLFYLFFFLELKADYFYNPYALNITEKDITLETGMVINKVFIDQDNVFNILESEHNNLHRLKEKAIKQGKFLRLTKRPSRANRTYSLLLEFSLSNGPNGKKLYRSTRTEEKSKKRTSRNNKKAREKIRREEYRKEYRKRLALEREENTRRLEEKERKRKERARRLEEQEKKRKSKERKKARKKAKLREKTKWIKASLPCQENDVRFTKIIGLFRFLDIYHEGEKVHHIAIDQRLKRHIKNTKAYAKKRKKKILIHIENIKKYMKESEISKKIWDLEKIAMQSDEVEEQATNEAQANEIPLAVPYLIHEFPPPFIHEI